MPYFPDTYNQLPMCPLPRDASRKLGLNKPETKLFAPVPKPNFPPVFFISVTGTTIHLAAQVQKNYP